MEVSDVIRGLNVRSIDETSQAAKKRAEEKRAKRKARNLRNKANGGFQR